MPTEPAPRQSIAPPKLSVFRPPSSNEVSKQAATGNPSYEDTTPIPFSFTLISSQLARLSEPLLSSWPLSSNHELDFASLTFWIRLRVVHRV